MRNRKEVNWFIGMIAVLLGLTLFKHINFRELTLEDPFLDVLYMIVFAIAIYLLVKDQKAKN